MATMKFDVKCVRECLVDNGRVFTVRSWNAEFAKECMVLVPGVGTCKKIRIGRVGGMKDIERYTRMSGFGTVEEWWTKVKSFGAEKGWLFLVVRKEV